MNGVFGILAVSGVHIVRDIDGFLYQLDAAAKDGSFPTDVWEEATACDCDCQLDNAKERLGAYMGCIDKTKDTDGGKLWKSGADKICACGGKPDGEFPAEGLECLPPPMANAIKQMDKAAACDIDGFPECEGKMCADS